MPTVSVILTSFNHGQFIREAIESVLNQTFQDFELIIWDDASDDNSWEVIRSCCDPRIKAFRNEQNKGPVFGVNKAIFEIAQGKYIAIHHSDDVWELNKLKVQVDFLESNLNIGAVFSNALPTDERGLPLSDPGHRYYDLFDQPNRSRHEWLRHFFLVGNALCHPSILIRKKCYEDCGSYRESLAQMPDFDMWVRLCLQHEIYVLPQKLVRFRLLDNEANASGDRPEARIRGHYEFYKVLQNFQKVNRLDDLIAIFPSAAEYRKDEVDVEFVCARIALQETPFASGRLFFQDVLFELISNKERSAAIKRLYGFDYKDFITLTAQYDVFAKEEVANLWRAINKLNEDKEMLNKDKEMIYRSMSWRVTRPIRLVGKMIGKVAILLNRA